MSSQSFKQEMPPKGGFGGITWERIPLKKAWSGRKTFAVFFLISAASYRVYAENIRYKKRNKRANDEVTVALEPLLIAERDRIFLDQLYKNREEEKELMKNVPDWKVGTLYGDNLYKTIGDTIIDPILQEYYAHANPKSRDAMHTYDFWF